MPTLADTGNASTFGVFYVFLLFLIIMAIPIVEKAIAGPRTSNAPSVLLTVCTICLGAATLAAQRGELAEARELLERRARWPAIWRITSPGLASR